MTAPTPHPTRATRPGRPGRRLRGDDGSVSVEIAILFPALLLLITAIVQYGLWFHARSVAQAAAQEGAVAAATYQAPADAGAERARVFLETHGNDTLLNAEVNQSAPAVGQVAVQVSGRALSLVPGAVGIEVSQSARAPIERFTVAGGP